MPPPSDSGPDNSGASPRLRRATTMGEGGRGLLLVARFAGRRGTANGKVIRTEQPLPAGNGG